MPISFRQELLRKAVHSSSRWMAVVMALLPGAGLAAIAEFFNAELHVDDNFSIPLIV